MAAAPVSPLVTLSNGNQMPILGLGTWKSKPGEVKASVLTAILDGGYRHIDCAFVYGNEDEVGQALKEVIEAGVKREELFITSKCWNIFHSRPKVADCLDMSLKRLGLDYLDLYLIHWPMGYQEGGDIFPKDKDDNIIPSDVDIMETWKGMEDALNAKKVKSIGVSNFNSHQIERILKEGSVKPVMNQVESHPYLTQEKLIAFCKERNIAVTAYSPLGSPDRPWAKPGEPSLLQEPAIKEMAVKYGKSPAQILIRFQVQRGVIVIPKSVTKERIVANIQVTDFALSEAEMEQIRGFNRNYRFVPILVSKHHPEYPFSAEF